MRVQLTESSGLQNRKAQLEPAARARREECAIAAKGKSGEWLTEDGLLTVEGWAREGLTDLQIATKMRISQTTFYDWLKRFPKLAKALKKGKAPVDTKVENALLKRALGYDYVETVTEYTFSETERDENGEPKRIVKSQKSTRKHVPGEVGAQAFWLKNRRPDRWREKREEQIQVTQADYSLLQEVAKAVEEDE